MEYYCCVCKNNVSARVYEYSMAHFERALCMKHQELEKQKWYCQKCKKPISRTVYDYSIGHFSKPLCIDCQRYHHLMATKGDNTFKGKGFYCNKCKKIISFPRYRSTISTTMFHSAKIAKTHGRNLPTNRQTSLEC